MKNVEGPGLPVELDRRLKAGVDRLKQARKTMEELTRLADTLGPLLGVGRGRRGARAASGPILVAKKTPQAARPAATTPPPAKGARTPPGSAPQEEEIPEWRKVFPALSANVPPKRSK
jgi:hypothetical protein